VNYGHQQTFKIYHQPTIITLNGLEDSDSIEDLKNKIQDKTGIPYGNLEFKKKYNNLLDLREKYDGKDINVLNNRQTPSH
jgi:hypothetical protein